MKLKPSEPFAGSSWVTEGLGFFAGSYGSPRILIAHPLSAEAGTLAGLAAAMGYEADVATNGREAYELAVKSPDYELVLIHSAIDRPPLDELLAQLRRDRRTALLPVGFMAPLDSLERVSEFARRAGRAEAFLQPQKEEEMKLYVGDVLLRAGRWHVPNEQRRAQALEALEWMIALDHSHNRVFDVSSLEPAIVPLLYVSDVAPRAAELLAEIGTDKTQRALLEVADAAAQPLAMRKSAVAALARSIRDHGILLTSDEIALQYDIYNDNAGRDAETHEVLGEVLDVIEHKGAPAEKS
jgi:CheY-like chemotaxis protein